MMQRPILVAKLKTLLGSAVLLTILGGCTTMSSNTPDYSEIRDPASDALVCKLPYNIVRPTPVKWSEVNWKVINNDEVAVLQEKVSSGGEVSYIALSPKDYENLSVNMADMRRYIVVQKKIIDGLEEYYSLPETQPTEK